jgi:hypothetical protein
MNMNRVLSLLIFVLLVTSFVAAPSKKKSKKKLKEGYIEMKKTVCYGRCPIYTVRISTDGQATYEGEKNVMKHGKFVKTFSASEVNALFDQFNKSDILNLKDEYDDKRISDLPSTIITYNYNGKTKKIVDRYNGPEELKTLEGLIEQMADSEGWKKEEDKK